MKRTSAIATAVAITGVIVTGSLATVAMVTATAETSKPTQTLTVVASGQPDPQVSSPELPELNLESATITTNPTPTNSKSEKSNETKAARTISEKSAKETVQGATEGEVLNVKKTQHNGVSAFAVTVSRPDGSVVTGYVDASSSVVFDWVVNKEAPKATVNTSDDDTVSSDDHGDDHGDDHDMDQDDD